MFRRWLVVVFFAVLSTACGKKLSDEACLDLRSKAFELLNAAHTCNDDTGCLDSEWPGCAKPASTKNLAGIVAFKKQFDEGQCVEPTSTCRDTPLVYCKQGLCTFRERAGQAGAK